MQQRLQQEEIKAKKEELEHSKSCYETQNAKQVFDDYPTVGRNAKWAFRVAIFVAFLELIRWIVELSYNKDGKQFFCIP